MSYVKLRTLSLKSKMKFGKFAEETVQSIIALFNRADYLIWVYYNQSNISFSEEILNALCIDYRITKPGVDKEYYENNRERFVGLLLKTEIKKPNPKGGTAEYYRNKNLLQRTKNITSLLYDKSMESKYSRRALQRINQGHK